MRLLELLRVEPGEGPMVGLTLGLSLFLGFSKIISSTVAAAIFLEAYSAENLAFVYLASSVVVAIVGAAQFWLTGRVAFSILHRASLGLLMLSSLGFLLLLRSTDAGWPGALLFVWYDVEVSLMALAFWSTANRLFTVRQGKRLLGLVGTGWVLATIVGGLAIPLVVEVIGARNLLALAVLGYLLAIVDLEIINRRYAERLVDDTESAVSKADPSESTSIRSMLSSRLLQLVFAFLCATGYVSYYLTDAAFLFEVRAQNPDAEALASFVGRFYAVVGVVSLVFQLLLAGRWMGWFGVRGALLTLPIASGMIALAIVSAQVLGAIAVVFWLVIALKFFERLLTNGVSYPAYYTLYQPLPAARRSAAQGVAETLVGPVAGGATALLLLLLTRVFGVGAVGLAWVLLGLVVGWVAIGLAAHRAYRAGVLSALRRHVLSPADLEFDDPEAIRSLVEGLLTRRPSEALYCLQLLEASGYPELPDLALRLLDRPEPELQIAALRILERVPSEATYDVLADRLPSAAGDPQLRYALLVALAATDPDRALEDMRGLLGASETDGRRAALVGLLSYGGLEGAVLAGTPLLELTESPDPSDRVLAAEVFGAVQVRSFFRRLLPLLDDPEPQVRRAALAAAGRIAHPRLWPPLVDTLRVRSLRADASAALAQGGDVVVPLLLEFMADSDAPTPARVSAARLLGRIEPRGVGTQLLELLEEAPVDLVADLLFAVGRCTLAREQEQRTALRRYLRREIERIHDVDTRISDLGLAPEWELLASALEDVAAASRERLFVLLGVLYPGERLQAVQAHASSASERTRDLALELLEQEIDGDDWQLVEPIVTQDPSPTGRRPDEVVEALRRDPPTWVDPWIRVLTGPAEDQEPVNSSLTPPSERVRLLRSAGVFSAVPGRDLFELAETVEERLLDAGDVLFEKGDLGTELFVITVGEVEMRVGETVLATLQQGEVLGEFAALDPAPRSATARAAASTRLLRIERSVLAELMADRVEVARAMLATLGRRLTASLAAQRPSRSTAEQAVSNRGRPTTWIERESGEPLSLLERTIVLRSGELFERAEEAVVTALAEHAIERTVRSGVTLFEKGDTGDTMFIVVEGSVEVVDNGETLAVLGPGAVFGELALLTSEPRSASVRAATRTHLLALEQRALGGLFREDAGVIDGLMAVLVRRLRALAQE